MTPIKQLLEHKLVVMLTVIGGIVFTLWDPLTNLFYTGYFHNNVTLEMKAQSFTLSQNKELLVLHVLPTNKGNVPISIKDKNSFILEIRKIENPEKFAWIEPSKLQLISQIDMLRNLPTPSDPFTLEANGAYDTTEAIPLDDGVYWINAILKHSGGVVTDSVILKLPMKN